MADAPQKTAGELQLSRMDAEWLANRLMDGCPGAPIPLGTIELRATIDNAEVVRRLTITPDDVLAMLAARKERRARAAEARAASEGKSGADAG